MLLSTDLCIYYPSSKKVLPKGSGDHHSNSPMNAIQRSDQGESKDCRYIHITALLSMAREDHRTGERKTIRARIAGGLLSMAFLTKGCMIKTGTITISIDFRRT